MSERQLTSKQRVVLAAFSDGEERNEYEAARLIRRWPDGYGQPTYLYAHLRALTARGLLERRKVAGNFARWRITDDGRKAIA